MVLMSTPATAASPAPATYRAGRAERWVYLRDLLRELIARDLRLRYRGSMLGALWTLLNPLAELAVLLFIFDIVLPLNIPNYGPFLFTGLLVFGWFQSSLMSATAVIVSNRELVRRPGFPVATLPVVTVAASLVHFVLALPVLGALVVYSGVELTRMLWLMPLLMAVQFVFTLALAYPLAAIHVWFRDTQYLLKVALQLMFYLTPVFYEASAIPKGYDYLYRLNPIVTIVEGYRDVLLRGAAPPLIPWLVISAVTVVLLVNGLALFRDTSHRFADEL